MNASDAALLALGRRLLAWGYRFTTVTPETHARVNERPSSAEAKTLRDVFGWSRPFREGTLPGDLFGLLEASGALRRTGDRFVSGVRVSSLGDGLYFHSAHPTVEPDAVFFGPDTYRFAAWLRRVVPSGVGTLVDVGAGSGAGALSLASRASKLVLADINPGALRLSTVNAALAGVEAKTAVVESDVLRGVHGPVDVVVSNPPYLVDARARTYRHGGARGIALSVRIVEEALERLSPGGRLFLYTGTPVVEGEDLFRSALRATLERVRGEVSYEELDPDVFGEELSTSAYADTDRLAVVGLSVCLS